MAHTNPARLVPPTVMTGREARGRPCRKPPDTLQAKLNLLFVMRLQEPPIQAFRKLHHFQGFTVLAAGW